MYNVYIIAIPSRNLINVYNQKQKVYQIVDVASTHGRFVMLVCAISAP